MKLNKNVILYGMLCGLSAAVCYGKKDNSLSHHANKLANQSVKQEAKKLKKEEAKRKKEEKIAKKEAKKNKNNGKPQEVSNNSLKNELHKMNERVMRYAESAKHSLRGREADKIEEMMWYRYAGARRSMSQVYKACAMQSDDLPEVHEAKQQIRDTLNHWFNMWQEKCLEAGHGSAKAKESFSKQLIYVVSWVPEMLYLKDHAGKTLVSVAFECGLETFINAVTEYDLNLLQVPCTYKGHVVTVWQALPLAMPGVFDGYKKRLDEINEQWERKYNEIDAISAIEQVKRSYLYVPAPITTAESRKYAEKLPLRLACQLKRDMLAKQICEYAIRDGSFGATHDADTLIVQYSSALRSLIEYVIKHVPNRAHEVLMAALKNLPGFVDHYNALLFAMEGRLWKAASEIIDSDPNALRQKSLSRKTPMDMLRKYYTPEADFRELANKVRAAAQ